MHQAGKDKYGHFVMFGDFRSAMPDAETAKASAAAPELLAACVEAVHTFEIEVPHGNPTIAALKAAIAKATA